MTGRCLHCQNPLPPAESAYCCSGCKAARELIESAGLLHYYDLRGGPGAVVAETPTKGEVWLEARQELLKRSSDPVTRLELDVQGLHCAACVWVVERLFEKQDGAQGVVVNPGAGKISMVVKPGSFDLQGFSAQLARIGYRLGPSSKGVESASKGLLLRIGICAALTMNVMIFTFAIYSGLSEGPLYGLMMNASLVLTSLAVAVGGWPFFRSAFESLRQGALHLDVPIALGVGLAYGGSVLSYVSQRGSASYFDTVSTFVTLMLVGRLLQERVLERNRRALLADDGVENLYTHTVVDGQMKAARVGEIRSGDRLLLRPGDLVPVDARAPGKKTLVSREWITGESMAIEVEPWGEIEAGSFLSGDQAIEAEALGDYASSRLAGLLRTPPKGGDDRARRTAFWSLLSRWYVAVTMLIAGGAGVGWWATGHSWGRVIEVVVAILVVTCPCAFGIAVPVAYEIAQGALRRGGVFVRSASLLDRMGQVKRVVFDKTGTLTLGELELASPGELASLSAADRQALWDLSARSSHPKSRAVTRALLPLGLRLSAMDVREVTGRGVEGELGGRRFRLGASGWAGDAQADLVFSGEQTLGLPTRERVRHDAPEQLAELVAAGYEIHLLSGDRRERVEALAQRLRIDPSRVRAGASPEEKRAYVAGDDAMMIGDGVNDAAAMTSALCSATPAGDLPFLPSRTDAYVQGELVTGIRRLLLVGKRQQQVVREAVSFGVAYNVLAVSAACLGWMSPLIAAVIMPLSSVAVVSFVIVRLRGVDHLTHDAPKPEGALAPSPGAA